MTDEPNRAPKSMSEPRPFLAPKAFLPLLMAQAVLMFGDAFVRSLDLTREVSSRLGFARLALFGVLIYFTMRIHRRWLKAQGLLEERVRRRMRPEVWIGLAAFIVPGVIAKYLGADVKTGGVIAGLSTMVVMALVVFAGIREPKRKARDEAAHMDRVSHPFD